MSLSLVTLKNAIVVREHRVLDTSVLYGDSGQKCQPVHHPRGSGMFTAGNWMTMGTLLVSQSSMRHEIHLLI